MNCELGEIRSTRLAFAKWYCRAIPSDGRLDRTFGPAPKLRVERQAEAYLRKEGI